LKEFCNAQWEKAFSSNDSSRENVNRKATIGLETLIQASDIPHTMQPLQVYTKWNEQLFCVSSPIVDIHVVLTFTAEYLIALCFIFFPFYRNCTRNISRGALRPIQVVFGSKEKSDSLIFTVSTVALLALPRNVINP
jgi:hypothetical protein